MRTTRLSVRRWPVLLTLGLSLSVALLPGCKEPDAQPAAPQGSPASGEAVAVETAFPGRTGIERQGKLFGMPITYEEVDGKAVLDGDILLSADQLAGGEASSSGRTAAAGVGPSHLWPLGRIYYNIDPALPNKALVTEAIAHWEQNTNVRFQVRSTESDYVTFTSGPGNASYLGRIGGHQYIYMAGNCTKANLIHEIGHTVGLFHEHGRYDRDQHIVIHWSNIQLGKAQYFQKYTEWNPNYQGFDHGKFDFNSRMLFPFNAYAVDPSKPTISKIGGGSYVTYGFSLSAGDKAAVNDMYPAGFGQVPGKAKNIAAGTADNVYVISDKAVTVPYFKGYEIRRWVESTLSWETMPGAGVDIDVPGSGKPWMVNALHEIFRFNGADWEKMPGAAWAIGAGANGSVYIVSNTAAQGGYYIHRWTGTDWKKVGSRGGVAVDVDQNGTPWMIDASHNVYRLNANQEWEAKSGKATDIGIGGSGSVYIVGDVPDSDGNYAISKWGGSSWIVQKGRARKISIGNMDSPWITNAYNSIYRRSTIVYTPPQE